MGQQQKKAILSHKLFNSSNNSPIWIDSKCDDFKSITITKRLVKANDKVTLYGHGQITGRFYFCVKILQMSENGKMNIGMTDALNAIPDMPSIHKHNWVYYSSFGAVSANLSCINSGCKEAKAGDKIELEGNISTGFLEWRLNRSLLYRHKLKNFENKDINWVLLLGLSKSTSLKFVEILINIELIPVELALSLYTWDDDLLREICILSEKSMVTDSLEVS